MAEEMKEVVEISVEDFNKMKAELESLRAQKQAVPNFNMSVPNTAGPMSVPAFLQPQKKSGWETFGKVAIGATLGILGTIVVGALTGSAGSDINTFGGSMP